MGERFRKLSGAQLKYIAFLSMLIDHTNKAIIGPYLTGTGPLVTVSTVFDVLGRIAFPLFCFFIVEGFFHTHDRKKYLAWLLGFGVISEIPFDLFDSAVWFNPRSNNVMFSLALGLITIWIVDAIRQKLQDRPAAVWVLASLPVLAVMCLAAMFSSADYEQYAVIVIYLFYVFRRFPAVAGLLGWLTLLKEIWSILGFGLTLTYNGKRGRQYKLLNYLFYPVHLLILGLLRLYLGI